MQIRLDKQTILFLEEYRKLKDDKSGPMPSTTKMVNAMVKNRIRDLVPEKMKRKFLEKVFQT